MNEPDWENIRGLRVIGWMISFGWQNTRSSARTHPLGKTGKNFEVVGYFKPAPFNQEKKPDQDKLLLLRDVAGYSSELYQVHFSWVILE